MLRIAEDEAKSVLCGRPIERAFRSSAGTRSRPICETFENVQEKEISREFRRRTGQQ